MTDAEALGISVGLVITIVIVLIIVVGISAVIRLFINISKTAENTELMKEALTKNNSPNNQNEVAAQQDSIPKIKPENCVKSQTAETEKLNQRLQKLQKDKEMLLFLVTTTYRKIADSPYSDKFQVLLRQIDNILQKIND
ncbi:MAG: hypothetical protein BWY26_01008 [Elusimicrobia bacterium ADurb.Bin231]|nr:MAG: hypothetical protein BWY26_01008 [Elusimicrobia bacterium ADurb.Bin231]